MKATPKPATPSQPWALMGIILLVVIFGSLFMWVREHQFFLEAKAGEAAAREEKAALVDKLYSSLIIAVEKFDPEGAPEKNVPLAEKIETLNRVMEEDIIVLIEGYNYCLQENQDIENLKNQCSQALSECASELQKLNAPSPVIEKVQKALPWISLGASIIKAFAGIPG